MLASLLIDFHIPNLIPNNRTNHPQLLLSGQTAPRWTVAAIDAPVDAFGAWHRKPPGTGTQTPGTGNSWVDTAIPRAKVSVRQMNLTWRWWWSKRWKDRWKRVHACWGWRWGNMSENEDDDEKIMNWTPQNEINVWERSKKMIPYRKRHVISKLGTTN